MREIRARCGFLKHKMMIRAQSEVCTQDQSGRMGACGTPVLRGAHSRWRPSARQAAVRPCAVPWRWCLPSSWQRPHNASPLIPLQRCSAAGPTGGGEHGELQRWIVDAINRKTRSTYPRGNTVHQHPLEVVERGRELEHLARGVTRKRGDEVFCLLGAER